MTGHTPKVLVLTNQTSPYQVEFIDAIAQAGKVKLQVIYLYSQRPGRNWSQPEIKHSHLILNGDQKRFSEAQRWMNEAELMVFSYYRDAFAFELLQSRAQLKLPWCFWGERMGVTKFGWAGRLYRWWKLASLHHSPAAIWGIGEFALERYRREFGSQRVYRNVPYFSNLSRFSITNPRDFAHNERRILYSGSLIKRKGADVLAKAFRMASRRCPNLRLTFLGEGPLQAALADELHGCAGRVTFAGFKDWSELPKEYHQADVQCVPSRHDGWGLVVPEGLAAGLPVISTTNTGAARELIQPNNNGWLVEAGNVPQLAAALESVAQLTADEMMRLSMSATASLANHSLPAGVNIFQEAVAASLEAWT